MVKWEVKIKGFPFNSLKCDCLQHGAGFMLSVDGMHVPRVAVKRLGRKDTDDCKVLSYVLSFSSTRLKSWCVMKSLEQPLTK